MTSATTTTARFRFLGITDDCTVCDKCGKAELKSTVILVALDADGNEESDALYYGSTCAARALAQRFGVRKTGRAILDEARAAHRQTVELARQARETLAHYDTFGGPESPQAWNAYALAHQGAWNGWARGYALKDWAPLVRDMYARRGAQIAAAERIGA